VIELRGLESLLSLRRRLEIPLSCIEKAAYVWSLNEDEKKQISPRLRIAGAYLGKAIYGHYLTKMGRAFFAARKYPEKSIAPVPKGMPAIQNNRHRCRGPKNNNTTNGENKKIATTPLEALKKQ